MIWVRILSPDGAEDGAYKFMIWGKVLLFEFELMICILWKWDADGELSVGVDECLRFGVTQETPFIS